MNTALLQYLVPVKDFYRKVLSDYEFSYGQLVLFLASILIAKIVYDIVYNYYISPFSVIPGPRFVQLANCRLSGKDWEEGCLHGFFPFTNNTDRLYV